MRAGAIVAISVVLASTGCQGSEAMGDYRVITGGDSDRGRTVVVARHCGACHEIPGITGAHGIIGPPLAGIARRSFIAGELPNTAANMARWVENPPGVAPGTAMPALGLDAAQSRDVAAYLYTLR